MFIKRIVGYCVLKLIGWSFDRDFEFQDKQLVIGFPHTSNIDGVRAMFMYPLLGVDAHFMVKEELFRWPFSWVLRYMGGLPVARGQQAGNQVEQIAGEFARREKFTLVMAPEGTRGSLNSDTPVIKTGFWHIARTAGVPIVLMISDEQQKHGHFIGTLQPSDDLQQDLLTLRDIYLREGLMLTLPDLPQQEISPLAE